MFPDLEKPLWQLYQEVKEYSPSSFKNSSSKTQKIAIKEKLLEFILQYLEKNVLSEILFKIAIIKLFAENLYWISYEIERLKKEDPHSGLLKLLEKTYNIALSPLTKYCILSPDQISKLSENSWSGELIKCAQDLFSISIHSWNKWLVEWSTQLNPGIKFIFKQIEIADCKTETLKHVNKTGYIIPSELDPDGKITPLALDETHSQKLTGTLIVATIELFALEELTKQNITQPKLSVYISRCEGLSFLPFVNNIRAALLAVQKLTFHRGFFGSAKPESSGSTSNGNHFGNAKPKPSGSTFHRGFFGNAEPPLQQNTTPQKNYYAILEIEPNATPDQITRAYKKLALRYHPDKNMGSETEKRIAGDKFIEVANAYEILGDPIKKQNYDNEQNYSQGMSNR